MKTLVSTGATLLLLSAAAVAQKGAPGDKAPAPATKPAPGAPVMKPADPAPKPEVAPPKPPAEIAQLGGMIGSWRCSGKLAASPMGPGHEFRAAYKAALDLDGFWLVGRYEEKRSAEHKVALKTISYITYDITNRRFID